MLELENEFEAEVSTGAIKFSGVTNDQLKEAVIKHPNHHAFVDEYILDFYNEFITEFNQSKN